MNQPHDHSGETIPLRIIEVGPRDGLQNEPGSFPTDEKIAFIDHLSRTGVAEIEIGAFVSPRAVPQMADTDEVARRIRRRPGVVYSALVPNERGLERARAAGIPKIAVLTAASETFSRRNLRTGIRETLEHLKPVIDGARQEGLMVRGYISTATHCPFEGPVEPFRVVEVMHRLLHYGVDEIALGETLGKAAPTEIRRLLDTLLPHIERSRLSLHVHDTYGMGVANVLTARMEYGIEAFDGSAGGLGGCPFAPGAAGNVATEDVVYALKASGAKVSVDEREVVAAVHRIAGWLSHPPVSRLSQVRSGPATTKV